MGTFISFSALSCCWSVSTREFCPYTKKAQSKKNIKNASIGNTDIKLFTAVPVAQLGVFLALTVCHGDFKAIFFLFHHSTKIRLGCFPVIWEASSQAKLVSRFYNSRNQSETFASKINVSPLPTSCCPF